MRWWDKLWEGTFESLRKEPSILSCVAGMSTLLYTRWEAGVRMVGIKGWSRAGLPIIEVSHLSIFCWASKLPYTGHGRRSLDWNPCDGLKSKALVQRAPIFPHWDHFEQQERRLTLEVERLGLRIGTEEVPWSSSLRPAGFCNALAFSAHAADLIDEALDWEPDASRAPQSLVWAEERLRRQGSLPPPSRKNTSSHF